MVFCDLTKCPALQTQATPGSKTARVRREGSGMAALALLLACCIAAPCASGDELSERGRQIFRQNRQAVVTVQVAIRTRVSIPGRDGQSAESRQDVVGAVLDPSGLTAVPLAATDPSPRLPGALDESKVKVETELIDLKILLEDGTELAAEVSWRDRELELAFIRPKTRPAAPMSALDLSRGGKADLLDQVVTLSRLGSGVNRVHGASAERIAAIVEKPRLFYVPEAGMSTTALGSPAFTLDGKPLGLFATHTTKSRSSDATTSPPRGDSVMGIIVPAADVLKAAKQALAEGAGQKAPATQ